MSRREIADAERQARERLEQQERDAELNRLLSERLSTFNERDIQLVRERLDDIVEVLGETAEAVDRLLFGGSVAKHTYVDGLSDVDALVVLDAPNSSPADLVRTFADALSVGLGGGDVASVGAGKLAVTVTYKDGSQIQLLPAVERAGHTSIATEDGSGWRRIRPHKFAQKLTAVNQANGNGVVPAIKLAKAAMVNVLPPNQQLSGYHVEAIAVDAFKNYAGRRDRVSMLRHLVGHAEAAVLNPTGDITGQSLHIDSYLGSAGSAARRAVSGSLHRLGLSLDRARDSSDYRRIFGD